jgi:predicted small metal-binding protein
MSKQVSCYELGIEHCDWVAQGETDEEIVKQVVAHLRSEHHMEVPDADAIMEGRVKNRSNLGSDEHEDAAVVIQRLGNLLDIEPYKEGPHSKPISSRFPNA